MTLRSRAERYTVSPWVHAPSLRFSRTSTDDLAKNLERAGDLVRRAATRGPALIALPKNVAFMGPRRRSSPPQSASNSGRCLRARLVATWASDLARATGAWILLGGLRRRPTTRRGSTTRNSALNAAGDRVAHYRKIHLFDIKLADGTEHRIACDPRRAYPVSRRPSDAGSLDLLTALLRFPEAVPRLVARMPLCSPFLRPSPCRPGATTGTCCSCPRHRIAVLRDRAAQWGSTAMAGLRTDTR